MKIVKINRDNILKTVFSILFTFLVASIILLFVSRNPFVVFWDIFIGAFGSGFGISETLVIAVPVILTAISVSLADRVGLLSIGAEGQLYMGAIGATLFLELIDYSNFSSLVLIPLMIIFSIVFGGTYSLIPGFLKAKINVNETLTTLLLNFVAILLVQYLINSSFKDPTTYNWPQSRIFPENSELLHFGEGRLHLGIIISILIAFMVFFIYKYTRWGFISKIIGSNPTLAEIYHLPKVKYIIVFMFLSGAIAGLAGFMQVSAIEGRLRFPISLEYGYTGFLVAWLANHNPIRIIPVAILMAGLLSGGDNVQLTQGLPFAFVKILQGIIFISFLSFTNADFTKIFSK